MRFWKRFSQATEGASALEFALVAPVFFAMMFGTIQLGIAYYYAGSVQFALEKVARTTMVNQDFSEGQVQAAFASELAVFTDEDVAISYVVDNGGAVPIAEFSATYSHQIVIPFVPSFTVTFPVVAHVPLEDD